MSNGVAVRAVLLVLLAIGLAQQARALDVVALVEAAEQAQRSAQFQGSFVVLQGEQMQAYSVARATDPGRPGEQFERVRLLSGPPQELERHSGVSTCIYAGDGTLLVSQLPDKPLLPMPGVISKSRHYELRDLGQDRVAGHRVRAVEMAPLDRMRYRHQFWIEPTTGLLLRSVTADPDGRVVAQMMFTQLDIGPPDIAWREQQPVVARTDSAKVKASDRFEVADLPPGFELIQVERRAGDLGEHQVYTDGLASFSIYVEPASERARRLEGPAARGPLNLFGLTVGGLHVTVVGEIPAEAAESLARSIKPSEERR